VDVRRSTAVEIGFDPFFTGAAEGLDFALRLSDASRGIAHCEGAIIVHRPRERAWRNGGGGRA
jgi:hypothetical protein